jgi:hypothetical protein
MTTKETVTATKFGFVVVNFQNGAWKAMALSDIKGIGSRGEGKAVVRLKNDHGVLVGVPFQQVMAAIASASEEGCHAAS